MNVIPNKDLFNEYQSFGGEILKHCNAGRSVDDVLLVISDSHNEVTSHPISDNSRRILFDHPWASICELDGLQRRSHTIVLLVPRGQDPLPHSFDP